MKEGKIALGTTISAVTIIILLAMGQVHPISSTIGIISMIASIVALVLIGAGLSELEVFQLEAGKNIGKKENISKIITLKELAKILEAKYLIFTLENIIERTNEYPLGIISIKKIITYDNETIYSTTPDTRTVMLDTIHKWQENPNLKFGLGETYILFDGTALDKAIAQ